jgi:hypothetical protein
LSDFLADLMHYCRLKEFDFHLELSRASRHFEEEVKKMKR